MKIENSTPLIVAASGTVKNGEAKSAQSVTTQPQESTVVLSPLSSRMQEISSGMAKSSTFDPNRLADIKQSISEGKMKVDVSTIASGLVDSVRLMLSQAQEPARS